jgi:hypothetical protein
MKEDRSLFFSYLSHFSLYLTKWPVWNCDSGGGLKCFSPINASK